MNWFRHDTAASRNKKLKSVIRIHHDLGYAVYFFCLERINEQIKENRLTFDLDYTAEDIVEGLCVQPTPTQLAVDRVNSVMRDMVRFNLFQEHQGVIYCFQSAEQITTGQIKNPQMQEIRTRIQMKIGDNSKVFLENLGNIADKARKNHQTSQVSTPEGNSESSRKIVEDPGKALPDYTRLEENNNTTRDENPDPVDNSVDNVDNFDDDEPPLYPSESGPVVPPAMGPGRTVYPPTAGDMEELLALWKASPSLPPFRGGIKSLKSPEAIRLHCGLYTQAERLKALSNLAKIKADPVAFGNLWPDYLDPSAFLRGGIAHYSDEAKPFDRCLTKGTRGATRAKRLYCKHCGTVKAQAYCTNPRCFDTGKAPEWTEVAP